MDKTFNAENYEEKKLLRADFTAESAESSQRKMRSWVAFYRKGRKELRIERQVRAGFYRRELRREKISKSSIYRREFAEKKIR